MNTNTPLVYSPAQRLVYIPAQRLGSRCPRQHGAAFLSPFGCRAPFGRERGLGGFTQVPDQNGVSVPQQLQLRNVWYKPRNFNPATEREFFIDDLLVRIHLISEMIWWTGLAPWKFEIPFPGSTTSTLQEFPTTDAPSLMQT